MKNLFLGLLALSLSFFIVISCDKTEVQEVEEDVKSEQSAGFRADDKKRHIIFISWNPGRPNHDCTGFGMCNTQICGFCCTVNGEIVPCNEGQSTTNSGSIIINSNSGVGTMEYALDINDPVEAGAIDNQSTFYIDENIEVDGAVILEGEYAYNPSIGTHGGYIINAVEN